MGAIITRNRYWWYRSLYDDYVGREMRLAFSLGSIIWIPHYLWGVHINRSMEVNFAHKNYECEWGPRRNRLTHSLLFEQFEVLLEEWQRLEEEFAERGEEMLTNK